MSVLSPASSRRCVLLLVGTLALLLSTPAAAIHVFELDIAVEDDLGTGLGSTDLATLDGMGLIGESSSTNSESVWLTGPATTGAGWTVDSWNSTIDFDPFITNNFTVTNNTGGTAVFTITVGSLIPAFNANEIIQSTIQLSVLDDDNSNGALLTSKPGVDVYEAFVNGGKELGLLGGALANYSLSCTDPFDCSVLGNGEDVDGVASQAFGPVVATELGLTITFQLSDGDSAQVLSRFEIVPEPGTGLLLGLGLVGLAARRRSRSA